MPHLAKNRFLLAKLLLLALGISSLLFSPVTVHDVLHQVGKSVSTTESKAQPPLPVSDQLEKIHQRLDQAEKSNKLAAGIQSELAKEVAQLKKEKEARLKREIEMNHSLNATEEARGKREDAQIIVKEEEAKAEEVIRLKAEGEAEITIIKNKTKEHPQKETRNMGEPFLKELSNVTLHSTKVAPSFTRVMPEEMAPKDYKCATLDFDEHTVSYPAELYTQSISNMTYNSTKKFIRDYNPELHDVNYSSHGVKFNYHEKVVHQKLDHGTKLVTVLPAWGRHAKNLWEKDNYWPDYSTAFSFGNNLCFWKSIPTTAKIESRSWSSVAANNTKIYKTVMVSSDFVDNFWHASRFINDWCRYKDSPIHFIIQTLNQPLSYIERFSEALGIADRIIVQKNDPILAETVLFPPRKYPLDWSCLHNHFADDSMAQDLVVIIYRKKDPSRSIPETIHNKLAQAVSEALPSLTVVTFNGNEDFITTIDTFRRAKIVIGPHGAAMTNLVFARRGIPVVEYLIPGLIDRPWGFYIGASIGQKWWPVQLSSFDNELEILKSVSTIEGIVKAEITLQ